MHFMCIIQIWTTCTCSSAYNWLKNQIYVLGCILRSHARNGNEFQTPAHRWLPAKHWDAWFLYSSKSMKLGMLSWSSINMPWYKFCPIWRRFGCILLKNWGKYLRYFALSPFPLQGKANTCSRGSKQMLQCTKVGWKIEYVSLGAYLGPMQEMRMNFKHQGTVDCRQNSEILVFKF